MVRSTLVLTILLLSLIAVLQVIGSEACPPEHAMQKDEHWGMPGGFSSPHNPTEEEMFILKRAWFETVNKCSHLPKEMEHVKKRTNASTVVAGMNYEYTLSDSTGRIFKTVIYVPVGQDANNEKVLHVTMCESQGGKTEAVEAA